MGGRLTAFLLAVVLSISIGTGAEGVSSTAAAERDFTLKVLPLMKAKCFACHGDDPKKIKGDLNMLTREALLKGGENLTNVLVPGNAKASQMVVAMTWENPDLEMPPKENDRLTKEQIELVRAWVNAGPLAGRGRAEEV